MSTPLEVTKTTSFMSQNLIALERLWELSQQCAPSGPVSCAPPEPTHPTHSTSSTPEPGTLVSGNDISGNSGDGVRLFAFGFASQTATLHSNLGVTPHNTITSNGTNLSSNGGVNQSVTP